MVYILTQLLLVGLSREDNLPTTCLFMCRLYVYIRYVYQIVLQCMCCSNAHEKPLSFDVTFEFYNPKLKFDITHLDIELAYVDLILIPYMGWILKYSMYYYVFSAVDFVLADNKSSIAFLLCSCICNLQFECQTSFNGLHTKKLMIKWQAHTV